MVCFCYTNNYNIRNRDLDPPHLLLGLLPRALEQRKDTLNDLDLLDQLPLGIIMHEVNAFPSLPVHQTLLGNV